MWNMNSVRGKVKVVLIISLLLSLSCYQNNLSESELSKCDLNVRQLLTDNPTKQKSIRSKINEEGKTLYHLIVLSNDSILFRELNIEVTSENSPYYVVWADVGQIVRLARSPHVLSIQRGALNYEQSVNEKNH